MFQATQEDSVVFERLHATQEDSVVTISRFLLSLDICCLAVFIRRHISIFIFNLSSLIFHLSSDARQKVS